LVDVGSEVAGNGVPGAVESGGVLVEDGAVAESGGMLVGAGAVACGADWAAVSWFVDSALVVSACWLHPYSNNPISVPAAAIWIFRIDFIFIIPFFGRSFSMFCTDCFSWVAVRSAP
jgi:hypothetical protein